MFRRPCSASPVFSGTLAISVCLISSACTQEAATTSAAYPSADYSSAPFLDESPEQRCVRFAAQMPAPRQADWIDWCHQDPLSAGAALNTVFYVTTRRLPPAPRELCMQSVIQIPYRDRAAHRARCFENPINALTTMYAAPPQQQEQTDTGLLTLEEEEQEAWLKTIAVVPAAGWEFVASAADSQSMVFASIYNLSRDGSIISLWYRWEFMNGQHNQGASDRFYSFVERDDVNCTIQASKQLAIAYYASNNLRSEGSSYLRDGTKVLWSPATSGTIAELMTTWACSRIEYIPSLAHPKGDPQ